MQIEMECLRKLTTTLKKLNTKLVSSKESCHWCVKTL